MNDVGADIVEEVLVVRNNQEGLLPRLEVAGGRERGRDVSEWKLRHTVILDPLTCRAR